MSGEINASLPSGVVSPSLLHIIKVEDDSGKAKLRIGPTKQIPTLMKRYIGVNVAFEYFQSKLCTEYATEDSAENRSAGNAEFAVTEVLES